MLDTLLLLALKRDLSVALFVSYSLVIQRGVSLHTKCTSYIFIWVLLSCTSVRLLIRRVVTRFDAVSVSGNGKSSAVAIEMCQV